MSWVTIAAVYLVVWWLCLFVVLPFGVRTQDESGETVLGTVGSAPVRPMLVRKAIITSVLAAIVTGAIWVANVEFGVDLESLSRIFG